MENSPFDIIDSKFPSVQKSEDSSLTSASYGLDSQNLLELVEFLKTEPSLYFDVLSCISGIDLGEEKPELSIRYDFYSITKDLKIALILAVNGNGKDELSQPIPSLNGLYKTANWLEREVFDLYGIPFENHPDLRRILLPADWESYPMRKSYSTPEKYHGLTIDHEDVIKNNNEQKD